MAAILPPHHHDTRVGTPPDKSLSCDSDNHLCAGFLAQSNVGYAPRSHSQDPRMDGSLCGRDGAVARSLVPLLSHSADGKRLRECPAVLPTATRKHEQFQSQQYCHADLDESSMEHPMDDSTTSTRKRKRTATSADEEWVESHPDRRQGCAVIGKFSQISTIKSDPTPVLGHVGLGTKATLSRAGIRRCRSEQRQQCRLAQFGGTFGQNPSPVDSNKYDSNSSGSASNLCPIVPSLAGHLKCGRTQAQSGRMEKMVVGGQGGGTLPKRLSTVSILYVEGIPGSQSRRYNNECIITRPRRIIKVKRSALTARELQPPVVLLAKQNTKATRNSPTKNLTKGDKTKDHTQNEPEQKKSNSKNSKNKNKNSQDSTSRENQESNSTGGTRLFFKRVENAWTWFFYARTTNLTTVTFIRTAYALLVLINLSLLWLDLDWFLHVMPTPLARKTMDPDTGCLLEYLPEGSEIWGPKVCVIVWMIHAALLAVSVKPQYQAFGVFACQYQLAHHNSLLWNGEDFVMRLLAFLFIFWPNNAPSFWEVLTRKKEYEENSWPMVSPLLNGGISISCTHSYFFWCLS